MAFTSDTNPDPADTATSPPGTAQSNAALLGALLAGLGIESGDGLERWLAIEEGAESLNPADDEDGWDEESVESKQPLKVRDAVQAYLQRIGRIPVLTATEEVELAKAIEAGVLAAERLDWNTSSARLQRELEQLAREGEFAKQKMIESNLRLVASISRRYTGRGMPYLDLIQEGNIGLMRAVEKFDHTKGNKFSTYATWWIKQAVSRAMADQMRPIRIPVHMVEQVNKVRYVVRSQMQIGAAEPTVDLIAANLGWDLPHAAQVLRVARTRPYSLNEPIPCADPDMAVHWPDFNERTVPLLHLIVDEYSDDPSELISFGLLQGQLESVLDTLSDRESGVIRMRYGLTGWGPMTLDEIGKVYGVTRERIRQIEYKTMQKLRHPSRSTVLRDYIDLRPQSEVAPDAEMDVLED